MGKMYLLSSPAKLEAGRLLDDFRCHVGKVSDEFLAQQKDPLQMDEFNARILPVANHRLEFSA